MTLRFRARQRLLQRKRHMRLYDSDRGRLAKAGKTGELDAMRLGAPSWFHLHLAAGDRAGVVREITARFFKSDEQEQACLSRDALRMLVSDAMHRGAMLYADRLDQARKDYMEEISQD